MTDISSPVSKVEADLIIRDRAAEYVDEHGADATIDGYPFWAARLSQDVGAKLDDDFLYDVLFHMDQVTAAENGTHTLQVHSRNGTLDNTPELLAYEQGLLTDTINHLLTDAGFTGGRVNGTGKQAA
ncbi:hypothetical protein SEA_SONALI_42 [Arthrobacter phage Sonali]|uniref:Uncharacterized protein n=1 Tax=Arthrobacter phage Sonali TaxID=2510495 RepID=A0A411CQF7_9CAUD|nr:hypothetical protein HOV09_gp42 [Arthrobacter phage Sonali]QAY16154.1 hypothetical protein SEA_SONALI_42 [Arthrobacter phage Sonali]